MIALIQWLVMGHLHKWKNLSQHDYYERDRLGNKMSDPQGIVYIQQCEKCGKVQRRSLT